MYVPGASILGESALFRVWAPRSERVDLVIGERSFKLERRDGGLFEVTVRGAGPGTRTASPTRAARSR